MVGKKAYSRIATCCLIAGLSLAASAAPFNVGEVTQAEGEVTFLDFAPPHHKVSKVKYKSKFVTDGSYLTRDDSFLTVQFFDGSWLRMSPRSKASVEFEPVSKIITLHLFTGSVKLLISSSQNDQQVSKLVVKSVDALFESSEGKFTVVRNPIADLSSVYVEKGLVLASLHSSDENSEVKLIHRQETTSLKDRDQAFEDPRKMTEKEIKFLHPSYYLKTTQKEI